MRRRSDDSSTRSWIAKAVIVVVSIVVVMCVGYWLYRGDTSALAQTTRGLEIILANVIGYYFGGRRERR